MSSHTCIRCGEEPKVFAGGTEFLISCQTKGCVKTLWWDSEWEAWVNWNNLNRETTDPTEHIDHASGATRSQDVDHLAMSLIHPIAMFALARVHTEGNTKYGEKNWEQGFPVEDCLNHALTHIFRHLAGDRSEDNLAKAFCNLEFAVVSDALWPHLNGKDRLPGCVVSQVSLDAIEAKKAAPLSKEEKAKLQQWNTSTLPEVKAILEERSKAS